VPVSGNNKSRTARILEARQRALEAVAERNAATYRKEDELRERTVEFEALKYQAAAVQRETEAEIARVRANGQSQLDDIRRQSGDQVAGMLALREPLGAVALRLGETPQTVKTLRNLVTQPLAVKPDASVAGEPDSVSPAGSAAYRAA
jgi:hypothetical protein